MSTKEKLNKFIRMLKIEVEDIQNDIETLIGIYKKRNEQGEITDYVLRENIGTLQREIIGVRQALHSFDNLSVERFDTLDDMISTIRAEIREKLHGCEYEQVLNDVIERKIEKLNGYIKS